MKMKKKNQYQKQFFKNLEMSSRNEKKSFSCFVLFFVFRPESTEWQIKKKKKQKWRRTGTNDE